MTVVPTLDAGVGTSFGMAWFLTATLAGIPLTAATAPAPTKSAPVSGLQLIARGVKALGGEAAIRKHATRVSSGTLEAPAYKLSGPVEIWQANPRKSFQRLKVAHTFEVTLGTDGQQAWVRLPGFGVQDLSGRQREQFIELSDIFETLRRTARYTNAVVSKPMRVAGIDCDVVVGLNRRGQKEVLYFGRTDGLLRRWDRAWVDAHGDFVPAEIYLSDYREVDGIKIPFKIEMPSPASQAFALTLRSVRHDVAIPDTLFRKPSS